MIDCRYLCPEVLCVVCALKGRISGPLDADMYMYNSPCLTFDESTAFNELHDLVLHCLWAWTRIRECWAAVQPLKIPVKLRICCLPRNAWPSQGDPTKHTPKRYVSKSQLIAGEKLIAFFNESGKGSETAVGLSHLPAQ